MSDFNIQELTRKNVLNMKPYSSARDEYKDFMHTMIYLDANENPFNNGVNRYPDPQQRKLKMLLSKFRKVAENQILLGNGSDEVLDLLFRAFCEPYKDNILTLPPTYGMYNVLAELNAVENIEVLLTSDFEPNVDAILEAANENSKILFLCSPNNPSGNSFSDEAILKILKNFKGLVVLDEAYIDFSENESYLSDLKLYPNLVIIQTLSKAYALAGLRIGILYAAPEIIEILNKIKPPYNVNTASQEQAEKKLMQNTLEAQVKKIKIEREKLMKSLERVKFIATIYPSDANFILIKVDDAVLRYNQLIERGIVVRNRSKQPLCDNCLRISIGTKEENENLIHALYQL